MAKPLHANSKFKNNLRLRMLCEKVPVMIFLLLLLVVSSNSLQAQIASIADGEWTSTGIWNPATIPSESDSVIINHVVIIPSGTTVEVDNLNINPLGHLIVDGSLIVNGDLVMTDEKNNFSYLDAYNESVIIIKGNVILSNKTNIGLNSYFIVLGNFSFSNGGGAADFDINDASIYVFGNFDKGGSSLVICDNYDNNTDDYNNETCHVGTDSAFYNNIEEDLIPDEIIEIVVTCNPTATISGDASICEGESATITVHLTGTANWILTFQLDGINYHTVENIDENPYTFYVTQAGVYTVSAVSDANCTGTTSGSATVTVHPLPATGEIIPD